MNTILRHILLLVVLTVMVGSVVALPPINSIPDESWWTENTNINKLYKWLQAANGEIEGGSKLGTGQVFYVDSGATTAGNGNSWGQPLPTIDGAVNKCVADRGDVIKVAQGHAETLAAAGALVACDIAGVRIVGMGTGSLRPAITLSDDEAIAFLVTAANVTIENIYIDATGVDLVAKPIDVGAVRCTINGIEILMADGTGQAVTGITTSGAANAADYMTIINCRFIAPDAGAAEAILLEEVEEGVVISGCYVYGDFSVAAIHNPTGKVLTNLLIKKCILKNDQTGDFALELVSACTGFLVENYYHTDASATAVDPGSCFSFECYGVDAVDESAFVRPAVGTP